MSDVLHRVCADVVVVNPSPGVLVTNGDVYIILVDIDSVLLDAISRHLKTRARKKVIEH